MIMLYRIKNIIKVYIIKKHNPIHTSKFKYLYYFSCILNVIHSPDSKAIEIPKAECWRNPTDVPQVEYRDYLNI